MCEFTEQELENAAPSSDEHGLLELQLRLLDAGDGTFVVPHDAKNTAQEAAAIVKWLETIASRNGAHAFVYDQDVSVSHTLRLIQTRRIGLQDDVVTSLDPDAALRSTRSLAPMDQDSENRFLKSLFSLLRRGQQKSMVEFCLKHGESWRAASFNGGAQENSRRLLWKQACCRLANSDRVNVWEKAIYGILGGSLEAALPVVRHSWEDLCWAAFRIVLDASIDTSLNEKSSHPEQPQDEERPFSATLIYLHHNLFSGSLPQQAPIATFLQSKSFSTKSSKRSFSEIGEQSPKALLARSINRRLPLRLLSCVLRCSCFFTSTQHNLTSRIWTQMDRSL
eukprot:GABV01000154.1.p1 GENE.GABV01000154.1~~GABV01000154.1.p1  ORF type:complete len:359 (+),score=60.38 GABV01000154.1:67-1077(+)